MKQSDATPIGYHRPPWGSPAGCASLLVNSTISVPRKGTSPPKTIYRYGMGATWRYTWSWWGTSPQGRPQSAHTPWLQKYLNKYQQDHLPECTPVQRFLDHHARLGRLLFHNRRRYPFSKCGVFRRFCFTVGYPVWKGFLCLDGWRQWMLF